MSRLHSAERQQQQLSIEHSPSKRESNVICIPSREDAQHTQRVAQAPTLRADCQCP